MKLIIPHALGIVAVFLCHGAFAQSAEQTMIPIVVPAPVRVLGSTQIQDPRAADVPPVPLTVSIDVSQVEKDVPEIKKWAKNAANVCEEWYPVICHALAGAGDSFKPPRRITLTFVTRLPSSWAAFAHAGVITISVESLSRDFSNYGMVVHELTHVVQGYPGSHGIFSWLQRKNNGMEWLSEGIADYVRFYLYEADPDRGGIRPTQSKYTDSYRSTACFLDYLVRNYDKDIVRKLNAALRHGAMDDVAFRKILLEDVSVRQTQRKDVDALYQDFLIEWAGENSRRS